MSSEQTDLTTSLEDYLKAILQLSQTRRVIRMKDIAKTLGVTPASASNAVQQLKQRGFVAHEKYEDVLLTEKGRTIAAELRQRHEELREFFEDVLLLAPETAELEACSLEHSISDVALERLRRLVSNIRQCPQVRGGCMRGLREMKKKTENRFSRTSAMRCSE